MSARFGGKLLTLLALFIGVNELQAQCRGGGASGGQTPLNSTTSSSGSLVYSVDPLIYQQAMAYRQQQMIAIQQMYQQQQMQNAMRIQQMQLAAQQNYARQQELRAAALERTETARRERSERNIAARLKRNNSSLASKN